jgi:hypothetical protein
MENTAAPRRYFAAVARTQRGAGNPLLDRGGDIIEMPSLLVRELSEIISQAVAPAFLLGATATFVSLLFVRLHRIGDRSTTLAAIDDHDLVKAQSKAGIPHLRRRMRLMARAIQCALISGIFTTFLVIFAFASAALGLDHAYGAAIVFVLALAFFSASLACLWFELRVALREPDHFL